MIFKFLENLYTPVILQVGQYPSHYDYSSHTIIATDQAEMATTNTRTAEELCQSIGMKYFPCRNALTANHEKKSTAIHTNKLESQWKNFKVLPRLIIH